MDTSLQIITTRDGSHTLYVPALSETYHSTHGAIRESQHVFIQHGLLHWRQEHNASAVNILEVGLGTGLNALLTCLAAEQTSTTVQYTALEPFPIPPAHTRCLNYTHRLAAHGHPSLDVLQTIFESIHAQPEGAFHALSDYYTLRKLPTPVADFVSPPASFDIVYFDAFAPSRQPSMWTLDVLSTTVNLIRPGGLLVTYCAQGQFKRHLQQLGMTVETLPGPPGKKEMTRATHSLAD